MFAQTLIIFCVYQFPFATHIMVVKLMDSQEEGEMDAKVGDCMVGNLLGGVSAHACTTYCATLLWFLDTILHLYHLYV